MINGSGEKLADFSKRFKAKRRIFFKQISARNFKIKSRSNYEKHFQIHRFYNNPYVSDLRCGANSENFGLGG